MDDAELDERYRQFLADPWAQFRVELKQRRAEQLRALLADPATMLLDSFNREVWQIESSTSLDGREIKVVEHLPTDLDVRALTAALRDGRLSLHGNYLWRAASRVYGSALREDATQKLGHVRQALGVLNQTDLPPAERAHRVEALPGFGPNTATGLVMIVHPEELALYNRESIAALSELGNDVSTPDRFQEAARELRDRVGAHDFIELDTFLYRARRVTVPPEQERAYWWVNQGQYYDRERAGEYVRAPVRSAGGRTLEHHLNVRLLRPGDVLLHYAAGEVKAIGLVAATPELVSGPDGGPPEAGDPGMWLARVTYLDVTQPLVLDRIPDNWCREEPASGPFDVHGGAKQGYLYPLTGWFGDHLWQQFADRLPQIPDPPTEPQVWLFQANPRLFPLAEELKRMRVGDEDDWLVTSSRRDMRPGQPVLLWLSGPDAGIYAVGELSSEAFERPVSAWRGEQSSGSATEWAVKFRYTRILDRPIRKEALLADPALRDMHILRYAQGTNFRVKPAEWAALQLLLFPPPPPPLRVTFAELQGALSRQQLRYSDEVLSNYLLALQTKRFVILAGISGTGKTRLAMAVARAFQQAAEGTARSTSAQEQQPRIRLQVVAVRPDWVDNRGLLGYYNPLTERYVTTPFLDLLLGARREWELAQREGREADPSFAVLDEMNLARVEHYFSDFLSAMESEEPLDLHSNPELETERDDWPAIPRRLPVPPNLFFTGTVNVDETTAMFSPKVLDRAFTIELEDVDLAGYGAPTEGNLPDSLRLTSFPGTLPPVRRPSLEDWAAFGEALDGAARKLLVALNDVLAKEHRHFGYRAANEIARFVTLATEQSDGSPEAAWAALDLAVLEKVLPKLHGTQGELGDLLAGLFRFAAFGGAPGSSGDPSSIEASWTLAGHALVRTPSATAEWPDTPRLPRTAAKLWRMLRRLRRQGFTSFIE